MICINFNLIEAMLTDFFFSSDLY